VEADRHERLDRLGHEIERLEETGVDRQEKVQ
jgi:hypothetical protein